MLIFWDIRGGRGKRAKNGPKWQKIVSIALHISGAIHHMLVLQGTHLFFFFHFLKILIFWVHKGIKGQKTQKIVLHSISQEPYIIWLSIMVRMCKMIISLSVSSSKFWFTGFSGGLKCKKGQKWQKRLSVAPYISGTYIIWSLFMVHICKMINISKCFFHFLIILIFGIISGVKEQKMT